MRLAFHNEGHVKSTKAFVPWEIVGFIEKESRSDATILKRKLKNLNSVIKDEVLKFKLNPNHLAIKVD